MNMVFYPWPSCNFLFTQILFSVFDFKKIIISSNYSPSYNFYSWSSFCRYYKWSTYYIFKLCCWCLVLKLIFIVDFISENLVKFLLVLIFCWAILFDFLCRQSYHLEIMRIVYSLSSLLSFNFFSLVLCSRTASIRLNRNDDSMPSCIAS